MSAAVDTIEIDPCPRCGGRHRYALRVVSSPISQYMPMPAGHTRREKSVVRLFVCPSDNANFQVTVSLTVEPGSRIKDVEVVGVKDDGMASEERSRIKVSAVQVVSPHNQALYEAGKKLLVDSIETGRDFCKFMITTNMAAIPIYLGLLKLVLPESPRPTLTTGVILLVPPLVFLAGASLSVAGYLPRHSTFSLDLPEDIDAERLATIHRRRRFALTAAVLFALAILLAAAIVIWTLSVPPSASAPRSR